MEVTRVLMTVRVQSQDQVAQAALLLEQQNAQLANVTYTHPNEDGSVTSASAQQADLGLLGGSAPAGSVPKVGRNDPCPCGSGKKFKACHGRLA